MHVPKYRVCRSYQYVFTYIYVYIYIHINTHVYIHMYIGKEIHRFDHVMRQPPLPHRTSQVFFCSTRGLWFAADDDSAAET